MRVSVAVAGSSWYVLAGLVSSVGGRHPFISICKHVEAEAFLFGDGLIEEVVLGE